MISTYNFKLEKEAIPAGVEYISSKLLDRRNNIEVVNLVPGIQSYINYLDLLMYLRGDWCSYGYLDLGMIPIIMAPSFMQEPITKLLLPVIKQSGLNIHSMPATSFLRKDTLTGTYEFWAFREDVGKFLGCSPDSVRTRMVLEKLTGEVYL